MRFVLARPKPDDASRHTPTVLKTNAQRKAASRIRCTPVVSSHRAGNPPSPTLAILPRSNTRFYAHPRINQRRTRFQLLPPHPASESTVPISPPLQERTLTPATQRPPPPPRHSTNRLPSPAPKTASPLILKHLLALFVQKQPSRPSHPNAQKCPTLHNFAQPAPKTPSTQNPAPRATRACPRGYNQKHGQAPRASPPPHRGR